MCGICGRVEAAPGAVVSAEAVRRMCDVMVHRGPDDEGIHVGPGVGLGMRRLSIIDVAGGKQPIGNEDGSVQVVFNGEIYNYRELRARLEAQGHRFSTRSDTEVIAHAYEERGEGCVEELRGMFAFALWDSKRRTLLLAVDRFGIKPLYYSVDRRGLVFGSELKCLLASGVLAREIDLEAVAQYFTYGYIPAPATIFRDALKLLPGHVLVWSAAEGARLSRYWDLRRTRPNHARSPGETREQLRAMLRDAVGSHLISDVPLGAFLSGGIDSSAIVALMSQTGSEPVKTFSIGFVEPQYNELDAARTVARHFGTDHHELVIEPQGMDALPAIVAHFDEPFADPAALPTYFVSRLARTSVKVALSGDGGDELFVGYPIFQGIEAARYAGLLPDALRSGLAASQSHLGRLLEPVLPERAGGWSKRIGDSLLDPLHAYEQKSTRLSMDGMRPLFTPELRERLAFCRPYLPVEEAFFSSPMAAGQHPLDRFIYTTAKVSLPWDMLVKVDRMSMAHSLEVRVPLLDHVLAEFVATIPVEQLFPRWKLKGLLKSALAGLLPPEILQRRKHGFNVPVSAWFRGDLAGYAREVLLSDDVRRHGLLDRGALEQLLQPSGNGCHDPGATLWLLVIFELWCRQVLD